MGPRAQIVTCRSFISEVVSQHVVRVGADWPEQTRVSILCKFVEWRKVRWKKPGPSETRQLALESQPIWRVGEAHHDGEAYINEEMVVILVTRWSSGGGRPCALRVRRANLEEAQLAITRSGWAPMERRGARITPNTLRASTRSAPEMKGSDGYWTLEQRRKNMISLVLLGWIFRLFLAANQPITVQANVT